MISIQTKLFAPIVWVGLVCGFWLSTACAQQLLPRVAYCTTCQTDAQWTHAAEQDSLTRWHRVSGTDQMYVLNTQNYQVRFYYVNRWYQEGAIDPRSTDPGSTDPSYKESYNDTADWKPPVSKLQSGFGYYYAEAVRGSGDPEVVNAIQEAFITLKDYISSVSSVPANELDLTDRIDSAFDLIGPDNSIADLNRIDLHNQLEQYLIARYNDAVVILFDLAKRFVDNFLGVSIFDLAEIVVEFEDGTSIKVKVVEFRERLLDDNAFGLELEVLTDTIRGPNISSVPQSDGHFNGFGYQGDSNIINELIDLAHRYGIPVTGPGGGGTGMQRMTCEIEGDEIRCKVTAFTGN